MQTKLEIIIFSCFTAIILIDVLNVSLKLRKVLKLSLIKQYAILKPLDCIVCFSFHISWITGLITQGLKLDVLITAMATYLVALTLERLRNL